jgi:hypothetical protein
MLLREHSIDSTAPSPATSAILKASDESNPISVEEAGKLHSTVAKLLYLSMRVRQDIQFIVNHLCTRVNKYDESDVRKLNRLLKYLNATKDHQLTLRAEALNPIPILVYADASFAIHPDGKSHSGLTITLGEGSVLSKSTKQKIVTKSSTEAELVCASDSIPIAYYIRDIINDIGHETMIILYQDNLGTIQLLKNGSNSLRTKHINVKYFHLKEKFEDGEIQIEHMPTEFMTADILSKPLQGFLFHELKSRLLNW